MSTPSTKFMIVAIDTGNDGHPIEVLTSTGDQPWRTLRGAMEMKWQLEAQQPADSNIEYLVVGSRRA